MTYQPFRLLDTKSSLYTYIKYMYFGLVGFYDISKTIGRLIPNLIYKCILDI